MFEIVSFMLRHISVTFHIRATFFPNDFTRFFFFII